MDQLQTPVCDTDRFARSSTTRARPTGGRSSAGVDAGGQGWQPGRVGAVGFVPLGIGHRDVDQQMGAAFGGGNGGQRPCVRLGLVTKMFRRGWAGLGMPSTQSRASLWRYALLQAHPSESPPTARRDGYLVALAMWASRERRLCRRSIRRSAPSRPEPSTETREHHRGLVGPQAAGSAMSDQ